MLEIKTFAFNPFQENTYVLYDETKECVIVDPGCYDSGEEQQLEKFISENGLKPVMLINTHAHVDHVFGNHFVHARYRLKPLLHKADLKILESLMQVANMYGLKASPSPEPERFIDEGEQLKFGNTTLDLLFTPGHSPGSLCLYHKESANLIAGDVLFQLSIGRSDLPGGDHNTLINSIKSKLMNLPDDVKVYAGHGPSTTIGYERKNNPFIA